jgi:hypothetical protein
MGGTEDIRDVAGLQAALAERPPALAQALLARAALRTLPLMETWLEWDEDAAMPMVLPTFRPLAGAWLAAVEAARRGSLRDLARDPESGLVTTAVEAAVRQATKAVSRATSVVAHTDSRQSFAYARLTFAAAVRAAYALSVPSDLPAAIRGLAHIGQSIDHWQVITADLSPALAALEAGRLEAFLTETPLWPEDTPDWFGHYWQRLRERLLTRPLERWQVWTDWYDARIDPASGRPFSAACERARILVPDAVWQAGPVHANPAIEEAIEAAAGAGTGAGPGSGGE